MSTSKILVGICLILILIIASLGGYYFYISGGLDKLGFSGKKEATQPTIAPLPSPIKQAVREDVQPDTEYGICSDLKDNPLVERIDLVQKGEELVFIGNLSGRVQDFVIGPEGIGQFNLVSSDGSTKKLVKAKDKAGLVVDLKQEVQSLKDLTNGLDVNVTFNCTRGVRPEISFVAVKITIIRPDDH